MTGPEMSSSGSARVRASVSVPIPGSSGAAPTPAELVSFHGLGDDLEHVAVLFPGWADASVPLVRLHSECLPGDVFGSAGCDCGHQLQEAVALMLDEGGIVLYLRQEGRGIGLYNKLDAMVLQDGGLDTYSANTALGFPEDARTYATAAQMLLALGVHTVRLLSNNPAKAEGLAVHGVTVQERCRTGVFVSTSNEGYLRSKVSMGGHRIDIPRSPCR